MKRADNFFCFSISISFFVMCLTLCKQNLKTFVQTSPMSKQMFGPMEHNLGTFNNKSTKEIPQFIINSPFIQHETLSWILTLLGMVYGHSYVVVTNGRTRVLLPLALHCSFLKFKIGFFHCHSLYSINFCWTSLTQHHVLPKMCDAKDIGNVVYVHNQILSFIVVYVVSSFHFNSCGIDRD